MNTRALAAQILEQVLPLNRQNRQPHSLSELMPNVAEQDKDKGLLQEICYGVCRWYTRLDKLAAPLIRHPFKARDADLHALLLVGLYQLFYLRIPDHATIAETVEACRQLDKAWAVKVINGMLRSAQRDKKSLEDQLPDSIAINSAHPKWLLDSLQAAWPEQTLSIVNANNEPGPLCLRVNVSRSTREDYLRALKSANLAARPGDLADSAIYLEKPVDVEQLPGFLDGMVSVQDEAAQLSAFLLNPQPGDHVLDACAAPGGKTCHFLEQQPAITSLIALDADAKRLLRVNDNLQRLQLSATTIAQSLEHFSQSYQGEKFDRILLDAPCSATGVIRRHPDIKWLRKRGDIAHLCETQFTLLQHAFQLLKPGGVLVYATCSVLPQENERVIQKFLKSESLAVELPIEAQWGIKTSVGRQLLPKPGGNDGFYYARIQRLSC